MVALAALVAAACSSSEDTTTTTATDTTTTTAAAPTTTTTAPTDTTGTTVAGETTTTAEGETTTTLAPAAVPPTAVIGLLEPYSPAGGELFPAGSVEAHWYQWNGFYVVLYRGFDAAAGREICAGNSALVEGTGFVAVTNSPYLGAADAICVDPVGAILEPPAGVRACGPLLYYLTVIPIDTEGTLYGTLEIGSGNNVWEGQTSQATANPGVPSFEPDLPAYALPPSDVDDLTTVTCAV